MGLDFTIANTVQIRLTVAITVHLVKCRNGSWSEAHEIHLTHVTLTQHVIRLWKLVLCLLAGLAELDLLLHLLDTEPRLFDLHVKLHITTTGGDYIWLHDM